MSRRRRSRAQELTAALSRLAGPLAGVLLGLWIAPTATALPPDAPHPDAMVFEEVEFDPPVPIRFELANGLVVYFLEDHALPLVSWRAYVRTGSVYERADRAGLAELVGEVLRTGGTAVHSPEQIDEELEDIASEIETHVGDDRTIVTATALVRHLEPTLAIFAELLQQPTFEGEKLEVVRGRAIEALRRRNDNPRSIVEREHRALLYGRHPYGRTPSDATLRSIDRADLVTFHERFFRPNNAILAVAGAVSAERLQELVQTTLGNWQRQTVDFPVVPSVPPVPSAGAPSVHHIEMDLTQSAIRLGHLGLDRYDEDRYAVGVMNHVLGSGGFVARLIQRLRVEEGIAYSVWSYFTLPQDTGIFYATTQTRSGMTVRAIHLMMEEIQRMRESGLTEVEFTEARSAILNSDIFRYVTPAQIVNQVAELEYDGYPIDQHQRRIAALRSMRLEDANDAARKYLQPDQLVTLLVGKAADFDTTLAVLGPVHEIELSRPNGPGE